MIDIDWLRKTCLKLPGATEQIQWGNDLLFKVGRKMFAIAPLEPAPVCLTFKCSDESFAELTERPGIIPAPYLARAKWVALETPEAITRDELLELLRTSYELVFTKLSKRAQEQANNGGMRVKNAGKRPSTVRKTKSVNRKKRN
jgi:predicted DNA-binding protein (MmcQ/YjbR family)